MQERSDEQLMTAVMAGDQQALAEHWQQDVERRRLDFTEATERMLEAAGQALSRFEGSQGLVAPAELLLGVGSK